MDIPINSREPDALRPIKFHPNFLWHPRGSVMVEMGRTRVLCAVSVQRGAPRWMREQNVPGGWVTSEYAMLPASTSDRKSRPGRTGRTDARALEIQRLIGRSLRAVVDLKLLPEVSIYVDCDVVDADGGTRCASICGGAVALRMALQNMFAHGEIKSLPMPELVAAVSVGIVDGKAVLDLDYELDSTADVDMNVVMTESGQLVEIQGTAEEGTFDRRQLNEMLDLAEKGIGEIIEAQRRALAD